LAESLSIVPHLPASTSAAHSESWRTAAAFKFGCAATACPVWFLDGIGVQKVFISKRFAAWQPVTIGQVVLGRGQVVQSSKIAGTAVLLLQSGAAGDL
jgi:hypothetical protein